MFSVGEKVVYGSMGVCVVAEIGDPGFDGAEGDYYILRPLYVPNSKAYVPVVDGFEKMRRLFSPKQMQDLIDSMPDIEPYQAGKDRHALYQFFKVAVKSSDGYLLAQLLKTLHERREKAIEQRKIPPSAERECVDTAERVLFGEIAEVLHLPLEQVTEYIDVRLGLGSSRQPA